MKMLKALCLACLMLFSTASFADDSDGSRGPSAESISIVKDGSTYGLTYLQDGRSGKPGLTWEMPFAFNQKLTFNMAVVYDLSDNAVATGPFLGYRILDLDYLRITPMVGVLQNLDASNAKTSFSYGICASVDLMKLFASPQAPGARLYSQEADRLSNKGLGVLGAYSLDDGLGAGVTWTVPLAGDLGFAPGLLVVSPNGMTTVNPIVGLDYKIWADSNNALSLWGGASYNIRDSYVKPTVGVSYTHSIF